MKLKLSSIEIVIHKKEERPKWTQHNIKSLPKQIRL